MISRTALRSLLEFCGKDTNFIATKPQKRYSGNVYIEEWECILASGPSDVFEKASGIFVNFPRGFNLKDVIDYRMVLFHRKARENLWKALSFLKHSDVPSFVPSDC